MGSNPIPKTIYWNYMKKKEAIYKIKNILDNLDGVCTSKLKAEAVLNELERAGVLPPAVQKLKKYETSHEGEIGLFEVVETVNEWEE